MPPNKPGYHGHCIYEYTNGSWSLVGTSQPVNCGSPVDLPTTPTNEGTRIKVDCATGNHEIINDLGGPGSAES